VKPWTSGFADQIDGYIRFKRALGLQFKTQVHYIRLFDRFATRTRHRGPLTQQLALDFAASAPSKHAAIRRYEVLKHFSSYLATMVPGTPILDRFALRRTEEPSPAHIFTGRELRRIIEGAPSGSPRRKILGEGLRVMIGLAASTGLRPGEVIRLDRSDVDWQRDLLQVRRTKFRKDRLVPVHPTTMRALQGYARRRNREFPGSACDAFFLNGRGERYASRALFVDFRRLLRRLGMRSPQGRGATFGDLRHTFAVRRMVGWYRAGVDVQSKLPVLATYMGHVDYRHTAYYVTATPELRGLAAGRLKRWLERKGAPVQ